MAAGRAQRRDETGDPRSPARADVSMPQLVAYFLRLGSLGFGGPAALVAIMEDDLVERRKWLTRDRYLEGLAICQTLPGPLAIQVGTYVGYICRGILGAWVAGGAFILPPFAIVLASAYLYQRFSAVTFVQALFYGISPVVIALIVHSCYRLAKIALKDRWLWGIGGIVALITALAQAEIALLFIGGGMVGMLRYGGRAQAKTAASTFMPAIAAGAAAGGHLLRSLLLFFIKAGSFTFGSGLVIVPFLRQGVVSQQHWLSERDFMVAVAIGMITPGPVVITATFVGYVVGAILGASVVLARLAIGDWFTVGITSLSGFVLFRWRVPAPLLVGIADAAGLVAFYSLRPTWVLIR